MKVFKFGGASIKDADGVRNIVNVLNHFPGEEILIVVSAMGKTTNAFEKVAESFYKGKEDTLELLKPIQKMHFDVVEDLFSDDEHHIRKEVETLFSQLEAICQRRSEDNFNKVYDRIVSYGELISTKIISGYLNSSGYWNKWLDARRLIRTDQNHCFARVQWQLTEQMIKETIQKGDRYVIQGFIGSDDDLNPTTLGREGSDYTASILAYMLDAEEVVIWKDVQGVLNGDPKVFEDMQLLEEISYLEAIELAYYGASIIHPKTIQPLWKKKITLKIKSFSNPSQKGTVVQEGKVLKPMLPCFNKKEKQVLLTITTRDLDFIVEDHLSMIYKIFHRFGIRVNMSQNTAISSSFCINHNSVTTPKLIEEFQKEFGVSYTEGVNLYTVRNYDTASYKRVCQNGKVLLEQISRGTYQVAMV